MKKPNFSRPYCIGLLIVFCLLSCRNKDQEVKPATELSSKPLFEKISHSKSQLVFNNVIKENVGTLENLFNYDYFYNGAGVGLEDLNNDGLLDVFFCGNQVSNKLFLNQGNFQFVDISETSGINEGKIWSNGITFVDINNDGWMDIYVSQGGPHQRLQRKNLLFINNKNGQFTESAESYGLADMGISTQSVFFDFDLDGDLDCLVMNENEYYGVDPITLQRLANQNDETKYFNSSHLYENENGKFKDITKKAGIERPIFGLGLSIADINEDGWPDMYIASDYYIPDALFINNKNGTFTDRIKEFTNQISYFGMGMDIADINNDTHQDIFVLDMASNDHVRSKTLMASMDTDRFDYLVNKANYHHQYMFNSLQLNTGNKNFTNIVQSTKMANTDWSWSVLLSDFDLDTDKDIYITNGYRRYALDNDLQRKVFEAKIKYNNNVPLDVKKRLYESMPSEKLSNILYQNNGDFNFKENAKKWGLNDLSFSNGAAIGDLDNDGDLDIVVNNIDENSFLYRNNAVELNTGNFLKVVPKGKKSESFPKITIFHNNNRQHIEVRRVRGYRSSHEHVAHFGLGTDENVDSLIITWSSGLSEKKFDIPSNTTLTLKEEDAKNTVQKSKQNSNFFFTNKEPSSIGLDYVHKENVYDDFEREVLLPYKQSTLGPFITKGDVNGDGLQDLHIGGASGQSGQLYLQLPSGNFTPKNSLALQEDRNYEDMSSTLFDFDNDGDLDLYVVSGGNEFPEYSSLYADRLYLNDGSGNYSRKDIAALGQRPNSGKMVVTMDYDKDGDLDVIVGNRIVPQNYPNPASSKIYENSAGDLYEVTSNVAPDFERYGIVNDIIATDFDQDGWTDFIAVGEWTEIGLFKNNKGTFENIGLKGASLNPKGWWYSVNETDINNDGLPDYIVGNVGTNIKFKASEKKPFKVYTTDFDDNGTNDIVLSKQYNGEYVPVRGRECSSQQMPFIKEKFETYSEFANAKLIDIYGDKLNTAYEAEVNEFKSILLINKGDGTFEITYLPSEGQFFPLMDAIGLDVNEDGYEDLLIAGNIYNTEVETPRLDAISGLILVSNKKDGYIPLPWSTSGLSYNGNIKDLELIKTPNGKLILASENNGPLTIFEHH